MRVDICVPIYNEEKILAQSAEQIIRYCENFLQYCDWRVVLIINGTTDNSNAIAQQLHDSNERLTYVDYKAGGRGRALHRYWSESDAELFAYMDSDLAVSLEALPLLITPLTEGRADLSLGSRYVSGAKVQRSLLREITSRAYSFITHIILKNPQRDLQCGFKAITKKAFGQLAGKATNTNWIFDTELITWANALHMRIAQVPVDWKEMRLGKRHSTVRLFDIIQDFILPMLALRKKIKHYKSSE